eukprot:2276918-Rhodomonas_salina.1
MAAAKSWMDLEMRTASPSTRWYSTPNGCWSLVQICTRKRPDQEFRNDIEFFSFQSKGPETVTRVGSV